ncbi:hypothetical protein CS022_00100 [Veronia nyctiphanis]|uniref:Acyltransferase n=1 Tax=Veronia nyctiphanis TaxID=1278244 RepID=A0A4Q0YV18_9GAMM|nr:acyltransferase [Veronia nyctiphanis]RXJ74693.1 hypothetical protein CS022_00100 [Veronia nyctiphanis]
MKNKVVLIYGWFIRMGLFFLPDAPVIMKFRGWLYSIAMKRAGANFQVSSSALLLGLENIIVGKDVYIAHGVVIAARDSIDLGDEVMVGFNSVLVSGNHTKVKDSNSYRFGKSETRPIRIYTGAWIASNTTVTAGTFIGEGALIGPASVASGHYESNTVNLCEKAKVKDSKKNV